MIIGRSSPISSLVLALQSAQGNSNWSLPNWVIGISAAPCQASAHGNSSITIWIPTTSPPREEFLSSKIGLGLLFFRNLVGLYVAWSASWSLKYDAGIHFASSTGYPYHRTKDSHRCRRVLELHRHRKISPRRSILAGLCRQVPHHLELATQCLVSTALVVPHETWDVVYTCQGVSIGMLESQFSPKSYKGHKTSTAACAECPWTSSFGYSERPYPQLQTICPCVSCHNNFFASPLVSPFALMHNARPPVSSPITSTMALHWWTHPPLATLQEVLDGIHS